MIALDSESLELHRESGGSDREACDFARDTIEFVRDTIAFDRDAIAAGSSVLGAGRVQQKPCDVWFCTETVDERSARPEPGACGSFHYPGPTGLVVGNC
jgi:hypothetical protein